MATPLTNGFSLQNDQSNVSNLKGNPTEPYLPVHPSKPFPPPEFASQWKQEINHYQDNLLSSYLRDDGKVNNEIKLDKSTKPTHIPTNISNQLKVTDEFMQTVLISDPKLTLGSSTISATLTYGRFQYYPFGQPTLKSWIFAYDILCVRTMIQKKQQQNLVILPVDHNSFIITALVLQKKKNVRLRVDLTFSATSRKEVSKWIYNLEKVIQMSIGNNLQTAIDKKIQLANNESKSSGKIKASNAIDLVNPTTTITPNSKEGIPCSPSQGCPSPSPKSPPTTKKFTALIIINPVSGKGRAKKLFEKKIKPLFDLADPFFTYEAKETTTADDAYNWARDLDIEKYQFVATLSGDGTLFSVVNGLLHRKDWLQVVKKISICPLPGGTGNALCHSVGAHNAETCAFHLIKQSVHPIDICAMKFLHADNSSKTIYSFLDWTYALVSDIDFESETLRWAGALRNDVYAVKRLMDLRRYRLTCAWLPTPGSENAYGATPSSKFWSPRQGERRHLKISTSVRCTSQPSCSHCSLKKNIQSRLQDAYSFPNAPDSKKILTPGGILKRNEKTVYPISSTSGVGTYPNSYVSPFGSKKPGEPHPLTTFFDENGQIVSISHMNDSSNSSKDSAEEVNTDSQSNNSVSNSSQEQVKKVSLDNPLPPVEDFEESAVLLPSASNSSATTSDPITTKNPVDSSVTNHPQTIPLSSEEFGPQILGPFPVVENVLQAIKLATNPDSSSAKKTSTSPQNNTSKSSSSSSTKDPVSSREQPLPLPHHQFRYIRAIDLENTPNQVLLPQGWEALQGSVVISMASLLSYQAGDVMFTPFAHLSDGSVDFLFVPENSSKAKLFSMFVTGKVENGTFIHEVPHVRYFKATRFLLIPAGRGRDTPDAEYDSLLKEYKKKPAASINEPAPGLIGIDGEMFRPSPLLGEVKQGLLTCVAARSHSLSFIRR